VDTRSPELPETPGSSDLPETQETPDSQENQTQPEDIKSLESYLGFLKAETAQLGPTPKIAELIGDIFETESGTSLAHCVSVDMKMNKGIAL